jgi:hypothetical protein
LQRAQRLPCLFSALHLPDDAWVRREGTDQLTFPRCRSAAARVWK